ncbi:hypothetical protein JCM5350_007819 [Sporobolomyces pararoseus]
MSTFKRLSRHLGLATTEKGSSTDNLNEKQPSHSSVSLPIPELSVTPASPSIPFESAYVPFALPADNHASFNSDEQPASPDLDTENEKHEPNQSYDDIPLSNSSPSPSHERRRSFPRFLHPEHLPPLFPSPLDEGSDRRRKRKRLVIRIFLLLAVIGTAIGLGVGLSRPNRSATSEDVGGIDQAPTSPRQGLEATRPVAIVATNSTPWTKLATREPPTSTSSSVTSSVGSSSAGVNPKPSSLGVAKGVGGDGGVQLDQRGPVVKHTGQRRTLRQFGHGTVAGWR